MDAATTSAGWKRKRPTLGPTQHDWSTTTPDNTDGVERSIESSTQSSTKKQPTQILPIITVSRLLSLPDEGISSLASYLSLHDARALATTCHYVRSSLVGNRATRSIWLNAMKDVFPSLYNQIYPSTSAKSESASPRQEREVIYVDDHHLPIAGLAGKKSEGQDDSSNEINLPLLMGLLPSRYPQRIDPSTLSLVIDRDAVRLTDSLTLIDIWRNEASLFEHISENNGRFYGTYRPFRSFELAIVFNDGVAMSCNGDQNDDSSAQLTSQARRIVPVVQFRGTVGPGNCCIRSDQPFPPNCGVVYCDMNSCNHSCRANRSTTEVKEKGSDSCGRNAIAESACTPAASEIVSEQVNLTSSNPKLDDNPAVALPIKSSQRSQLFSLLTGLTNRCSTRGVPSISDSIRYPNFGDDDASDSSGDHDYAFDGQSMGSSYSGSLSIDSSSHQSLASLGQMIDMDEEQEEDVISDDARSSDSDSVSIGSSSNLSFVSLGYIDMDGEEEREEEEVELSTCNDQGSRPFVVPTIVSDTAKDGVDFVVDVTPRLVAYFEVTIIKHEEGGCAGDQQNISHNEDDANNANNDAECVAIGLSTSRFRVHRKMPGWDCESFGYHGDEGSIYHNSSYRGSHYASRFGPGDTVGCGLKYDTREIFFTKNGHFLGHAFVVRKKMIENGLYPTVGVDTKSPVFVNYGNIPFRFDLNGFTAAARLEEEERKAEEAREKARDMA